MPQWLLEDFYEVLQDKFLPDSINFPPSHVARLFDNVHARYGIELSLVASYEIELRLHFLACSLNFELLISNVLSTYSID